MFQNKIIIFLSIVPDDVHSARRLLDDADILTTLERCFRLIHTPVRNDSAVELPMNSVPGSASSLRASITTYLARFLKRSIFDKIKMRQTRLDHNLFDVLWPAMKKATKERKVEEDINAGVVLPDFDVFVVFQEFLVPLIKDIHCIDIGADFQPHPPMTYFPVQRIEADNQTIEEEIETVHLNLDKSGRWILDGVVECCRNLDAYELPLNLNAGQLEDIERIITATILDIEFSKVIDEKEVGTYYTMNEVLDNPSEVRKILFVNRLLIPLLDESDINQAAEAIAVNGPHWPYGRGVYVSPKNDLAIWINCQDHFRVLCRTDTGTTADIGIPYTKVGKIMMYLSEKVDFRHSYFLGHLSSRPSCLGTSLRLCLTLHMPHLSKEKENLRHLCTVRGLHMNSLTTPSTIRVCNMQSLGATEWNIFQDFCTAVANLIQLEKDLSMANTNHIAAMLVNIFRKKKNSLTDSTATTTTTSAA